MSIHVTVDGQNKLTIDDSEENTLGSGGQGVVYKVNYQGKEWACKWYTVDLIQDNINFKNNLQRNTRIESPDRCFVWPQHFVESQDGGFGYLMEIIPDNFVKFTNIYLGKRRVKNPRTGKKETVDVRFKNIETQLTAAINIVNAFRTFHRKGMAYYDINDGGFFIDPDTGDVRICDCDNAKAAGDGTNPLVYGKPGYMAPEIVANQVLPDMRTDFHSVAVILFQMFVGGHPFDGRKLNGVMWTDDAMKKLYGTDPVFIFNPNDESNRPVAGVHSNPINMWPLIPKKMKDKFVRTFVDGIKNPSRRTTDNGWIEALNQFRGLLVRCCKDYSEIANEDAIKNGEYVCPHCNRKFMILTVNTDPIVANKGKAIYAISIGEKSTDKIIGKIGETYSKNRTLVGIVNFTQCSWTAIYPGREQEVPPKEGVPLVRGMVLKIRDSEEYTIIEGQGRVN